MIDERVSHEGKLRVRIVHENEAHSNHCSKPRCEHPQFYSIEVMRPRRHKGMIQSMGANVL